MKFRAIKLSDLSVINFEQIISSQEPNSFLINYVTNLGEVFGKLYITDNEFVFDPLNKKIKGFINQSKGDFFFNDKLSVSIDFRDMSGEVRIV